MARTLAGRGRTVKSDVALDTLVWFKVLNVNLSGAFFLSQAALRHTAQRGSGRIVCVSSVIGETGNIGQANDAASKSGLFGLTKTLARAAAVLLTRAGKLAEPDGAG